MAEETPKIVVDSDWKSQARAEKERLAAAEKQKATEKQRAAPPQGQPGPGGGPEADDQGVPQSDFASLIGSLATQALMYMGAFPDPETGRAIVSLDHARFHIELLGVLEEKTKGNLTEQEEQHLKQVLYQLRLQYVEISKAVAQAVKNKQAQAAGSAPSGPIGLGPGSLRG